MNYQPSNGLGVWEMTALHYGSTRKTILGMLSVHRVQSRKTALRVEPSDSPRFEPCITVLFCRPAHPYRGRVSTKGAKGVLSKPITTVDQSGLEVQGSAWIIPLQSSGTCWQARVRIASLPKRFFGKDAAAVVPDRYYKEAERFATLQRAAAKILAKLDDPSRSTSSTSSTPSAASASPASQASSASSASYASPASSEMVDASNSQQKVRKIAALPLLVFSQIAEDLDEMNAASLVILTEASSSDSGKQSEDVDMDDQEEDVPLTKESLIPETDPRWKGKGRAYNEEAEVQSAEPTTSDDDLDGLINGLRNVDLKRKAEDIKMDGTGGLGERKRITSEHRVLSVYHLSG
jgi:hypothetical protein